MLFLVLVHVFCNAGAFFGVLTSLQSDNWKTFIWMNLGGTHWAQNTTDSTGCCKKKIDIKI